ncbi:MAG TPA: sugar phosphate isomerase/epimerase family protein [Bryobacteraceae bacterium]|jgi:sugar phosphate isomerase/epimerase|nr:sugar phosphate isomerase/epimerase family protein [Bryobacteraceae bacterium]
MDTQSRRTFVGEAIAGLAAAVATASPGAKPQLGVVVSATGGVNPDAALARVKRLGFSSCQLGVGMAPAEMAPAIRAAIEKYQVHPTALMTLGEGRMVWNLREGPETIGVIPRATRKSRVDALKRASDLAKACGVKAVHTHCGFIPENPNDPLYAETVKVLRDVIGYARNNGQTFLCETGQETPITLLRAIQDVGLDNMAVNLDVANLILYGKGEPVGALDVLGAHVRGLHAKDGLYPTDPYGLGKETPIGSGRVRFPEVFHKLSALHYTGPVTIEREISGPRQELDIRESQEFLTKLIDREYGA